MKITPLVTEANGRADFISGVGRLRRRRRLNKTRKPVRFRPGQGTASRREYVQYAGMYSVHEYAQCARVCTVCASMYSTWVCTVCAGMYNMREYVQYAWVCTICVGMYNMGEYVKWLSKNTGKH